jgi:hypothetical protein
MLWHKSWLETRWRFVIALATLMLVACGSVFDYPRVAPLVATAKIDASGTAGRLLNEALEAERTYRGFIWWQLFRQNLTQLGTLFAALLGSGGLLAHGAAGTLFTLSLPVSRTRVLGVRSATALFELLALMLASSFLITFLSPLVGQSYSAADALAHAMCLFFGAAMFFSLAFLLSTVFADVWRPLLISCCAAVGVAVVQIVLRPVVHFSVFQVMSGESYFRGSGLPWLGLLATSAVSGLLLYLAVRNIARQDF